MAVEARRLRTVIAASLIAGLLPALALAADTRLADAAMKGDGAAVRALIGEKVDVNAPGVDGTPASLVAVRQALRLQELGSVSERVAHQARSSVLVVRPRPA